MQINIEDEVTNEDRVAISVENYGYSYEVNPDQIIYDKHPLIEAAIDVMKIPWDMSLKINIFSDAPPGASTGTSAAVSVALIGALIVLSANFMTPYEIASMAHFIETEKLNLRSGIQDQLSSA